MARVPALLIATALLGGTAFTLLFDEEAPRSQRLAAGTAVGIVSLGLLGFVAASVLGMGTAALGLAALLVLWPLPVLAARPAGRTRLRALFAFERPSPALAAGFALLAALLWRVYRRAMFETPAGIGTGDDHNLGDLPFHIGIVTGFALGENYPPQHPELAGTRLTYPFLNDMVTAMLLRAGADLEAAFFWPNVLLASALVVLLYHWARDLTADRLAGALTPLLVLFSGGLGFTQLAAELRTAPDPWAFLAELPHDYTISPDGPLRWGNAITTLLIPQRSLLLGLPLFMVMARWWWHAVRNEPDEAGARRKMTAAGVVAGLLPLAHAHSLALALALGAALAVLFPRWRLWARFFAAALALALPQVLWSASGSALQTRSFFGWHLGWDRGETHPVWFWLYNTGLFLPLLLVALAAHRRLLPPGLFRYVLPFACCFLVPNLARLSPWIWDNVKFLFYWWVGSAPLVALVLARLARASRPAAAAAAVLLLGLILSGSLDVWRVASGHRAHLIFDPEAIAFGRAIAETTPPGAVIAAVPAYDTPVLLSGRPALLGYTGHIWSQGLDAGEREQHLNNFYASAIDAAVLRDLYGVSYAVFGPSNRLESLSSKLPIVARTGRFALVRLP
jgi:hypothetical protein